MRLSVLRSQREVAPPTAEPPPGPPRPAPQWTRWLRLPRGQDLRAALTYNWGLKLVALLIAIFLWFSINVTERDAERMVELPVSVRKLQQGLVVTNPPNKPVQVVVRGPRTILDGVDEHRARVALDLSIVGPGDIRVELSPDMVTARSATFALIP